MSDSFIKFFLPIFIFVSNNEKNETYWHSLIDSLKKRENFIDQIHRNLILPYVIYVIPDLFHIWAIPKKVSVFGILIKPL